MEPIKADFLAVSATAVVINKNIIIHEKGHKPLCIPGSDVIDDQINVCYDPEMPHYDSLLSIDGTSTFLSPDQILFT